MKILFVTTLPIVYNTSANLRNIALIKGLSSLGHEVHILNIAVSEQSIGYDASLQNLIDNSIYYVKPNKVYSAMSTKKINKKSSIQYIKKIARNIFYAVNLTDSLASSIKNLKDVKIPDVFFDLIISSSDFRSSHLLAEEFIKLHPRKSGKWVQYWGDPLTIDINNKSKLPKKVIKTYENRILSKADKIIYVSPLTLEKQKEIFPSLASKMEYLPIAYIQTFVSKANLNNDKLNFGYFGDYFSNARNLMPLYLAMKGINANLTIVGNSDLSLKKKNNIIINSRKPYKEIQKLEEDTNVLICVCNNKGTQIPGKIYHYAATDKPILVITEDGSNSIERYLKQFDKKNKYVFCGNNEEDIRNALLSFINDNSYLFKEPIEEFSSYNIAKKFLEYSQFS